MTVPAPKSISLHLFIWLFVTGLLSLLFGGGILYLEVRNIIYSSLDHSLQSELEIFTGLLHIEEDELEFEYAEVALGNFEVPRSGHYYQLFVDGEVFATSLSLAGEELLLLPEQLETEDTELHLKIYTGLGPANDPVRIMARNFVFSGHSIRLAVAQSLTESHEMLRRFRDFLFLSGLVGILLIALLGRTISRRSLQPLENLSARIDRIGEKNLDQRLETDHQYLEIGSLAVAFNALLARLQKSLSDREELLSEVSHELKTPVTVIRSHCDIYLQKQRPTDEYIEALEVIRDSADVMGKKINRLLSIARIEAELMSASGFRSINLADCLHQARLTVEPLAREAQVRFSEQSEEGLQVDGHLERLIEAFSNLLENAVKYNCRGGAVSIIVTREGGQAQIRIEDTGCGIPAEDMEKIFQRFYRAEGVKQVEGSGLGLVLAKSIIEAHQGQIDVSTRAQGGSCFCVCLPLA